LHVSVQKQKNNNQKGKTGQTASLFPPYLFRFAYSPSHVLSPGIPFLVLGAIVIEPFAAFYYERNVLNDGNIMKMH
jgi:hypothetical protein